MSAQLRMGEASCKKTAYILHRCLAKGLLMLKPMCGDVGTGTLVRSKPVADIPHMLGPS